MLAQNLERGRFAEETGDLDEEVLVEGLDLLLVVEEDVKILADLVDLEQGHAAEDAALDRVLLVVAKIDGGARPQHGEDAPELIFLAMTGEGPAVGEGMARDAGEFAGDAIRREDVIDLPGADGGTGHAVVPGGIGLLGEGDAAGGLDLGNAEGTIAAGAGEDDADAVAGTLETDGTEEVIDRHVPGGGRPAGGKAKLAVFQVEVAIRGDDVDAVLRHRNGAEHLLDGKGGLPGEQLD